MTRRSSKTTGSAAEARARRWYRLRGYRVLDANAWAGRYELDLVLRRGRTLVFCEVKTKRGDRYGDPLEMVGATKSSRIRRAAETWLATHPEHRGLAVRLDVIAIRGGRVVRVPADADGA